MTSLSTLVFYGTIGALAGVASLPHCLAMCGPLAAWSSIGSRRNAWGYQAARVLGYTALGALFGAVGSTFSSYVEPRVAQTWATAMLAAALGVSLWRSWRSTAREPKAPELVQLRRGPRSVLASTVTGALTAILPCGSLLSAYAVAAASLSPVSGASAMVAFALVTGPALAAAAWIAKRIRNPWPMRVALGLALVLLVARPVMMWTTPTSEAPQAVCH